MKSGPLGCLIIKASIINIVVRRREEERSNGKENLRKRNRNEKSVMKLTRGKGERAKCKLQEGLGGFKFLLLNNLTEEV